MNYDLICSLPQKDATHFLEHILRSIHYSHKLPFSKDPKEPWKIVDAKGLVLADCQSSAFGDKFFDFLKNASPFFVKEE